MRRAGDRGGRRAEGGEGAQGGVGRDQRVVAGSAAALPSDAEHHLRGEELHHHLPDADRVPQLRRAVAARRRLVARALTTPLRR